MLDTILKFHKKLDLKVGEIVEGEVIEKKASEVFIDLGIFGIGRIYGLEYMTNKDIIKDLEVGEKIKVKVVGLKDKFGYIELSFKGIKNMIGWERVKEAYEKNEILELEVKDVNNGGLIVNCFSLKGFVPVSHLMPQYYPRVQENEKNKIAFYLRNLIGKRLRFRIIDFNPEEEKLILSQKAAEEETIQNYLMQLKVGQIVEGVVTGISKFGVFVKIKDWPIEGLVHISEIPSQIKEELKIGSDIKAKILKIEGNRVFFTLKFSEQV